MWSLNSRGVEKALAHEVQGNCWFVSWRLRWSRNLALEAKRPPQVGQATSFSWLWQRMCSLSLDTAVSVLLQPGHRHWREVRREEAWPPTCQ
jgi:hypothetical protein